MHKTKKRSVQQDIVVIYHGGCPDGFGGAWAAWKKFGSRASYIASFHNQEPALKPRDKEVYFIDITYSVEDMKRIAQMNRRVVIIDHHVTAEPKLKLATEFSFSSKHSAAVLAWEYFHPGMPLPELLRHIEDIDLWKFKLPHTKEIAVMTELQDFKFSNWNRLVRNIESPMRRRRYIEHGKLILQYQNKAIAELVAGTELVSFLGHRVLAVNSPLYHSEIGNLLCRKKPPFGIVWSEERGVVHISLRSAGAFNVAEMARRLGGGGHKNASGFEVKAGLPLPWKCLVNRLK